MSKVVFYAKKELNSQDSDSELEIMPKPTEIKANQPVEGAKAPTVDRHEIMAKAREGKRIKAEQMRQVLDTELEMKVEAKEIMKKELEKAMKKEAKKLTKAFGVEMVYGAAPELLAPREAKAEYNKKTRLTEPAKAREEPEPFSAEPPMKKRNGYGARSYAVKTEKSAAPDLTNGIVNHNPHYKIPVETPAPEPKPAPKPVKLEKEVKQPVQQNEPVVQQQQPVRVTQPVQQVQQQPVRVTQSVQQVQQQVNPYAQRLQQLQRMRGLASHLGL